MKDFLLPLKALAGAMGNIKNIRFLSILLIFFLISGEIGFAAGETTGLTKEDADGIIKILNGFIAIFGTLLGLVTAFITLFIFPGWTNGTLFGLQEYLRDIWILVSNVVYFIFAFILIVIAFMNIIGKGEGNWELKQALPRFIVGVLIVPFSWFVVQFILSISAVLTVAVLSLPYDVFSSRLTADTGGSEILNQDICFDIIILLQGEEGAPKGSTSIGGEDSPMSESVKCRDGGKAKIMDIVTGKAGSQGIKNSIFGIMSVYSYGILRVQELTKVDVGDIRFYKELVDLILKIVFDVLFILVYLLLMIALLLALFTRGIKLWIFIMLSPIFGLMYFFGKAKEGWNEKYSPTEFIALAMVPVYVAAALAFGLTFILVSTEGLKDTVGSGRSLDQLDLGGFKLEVIGALGDGELELGVIGKLITQIFGVAILWIAVMAALGASKNTKAIVEPIAKFGESVGQLAAAAPTYAPIIPTGGGPRSGMSVAGLGTFGSTLEAGMRSSATRRGSDFANEILPGGLDQVVRALQNQGRSINEGMMRNQETAEEQNRLLIDTLTRADWNNELRRNAAIETLIQMYPSREDDIRQINNYNDARRILPEIFHSSVPSIQVDGWRQMMEGSTGSRRDDDSGIGGGTTRGTNLARDVAITINTVPTTAGSYLASLGTITNEASLRDTLQTNGITETSTINAIIAAYQEGLADLDED